VDAVDLKLEAGEIHVYLRHHEVDRMALPGMRAACKLYDHQSERQWRHLDNLPIPPSAIMSGCKKSPAPWLLGYFL